MRVFHAHARMRRAGPPIRLSHCSNGVARRRTVAWTTNLTMRATRMVTSSCTAEPAKMKPSLLEPMARSYDPKQVESGWYAFWEQNGFFQPEVAVSQRAAWSTASAALGTEQKGATAQEENEVGGKLVDDFGRPFSMILPPPNVTGELHLGHALTVAVEDALVRFNRMRGRETVWVPGLDHAGIATQVVVEKYVQKHFGKTRHDLGRDEFVRAVFDWKVKYGGEIRNQLKTVGASLDWSRETFTMDAERSGAVTSAFVRLHEAGKIYRATRMVNWCCALQTVISDIEVDFADVDGPTLLTVPNHDSAVEVGVMFHFRFPVMQVRGPSLQSINAPTFLEIATTRPETMLADTGVAIHPADERYRVLAGADFAVLHPITGVQIPVVTDAVLVDPNVGTGVVKLTPGHDFNDYACGQTHNLQMPRCLDTDGKIHLDREWLQKHSTLSQTDINKLFVRYDGQDRFAARKEIVEDMQSRQLFVGRADHAMRIGICSRSGDIIEPMLQPQWFVKTEEFAHASLDAVRLHRLDPNRGINIVPRLYDRTWFMWLDNIQDWCISRQLWWGHRIPAWKIIGVVNESVNDQWIVATTQQHAYNLARERVGHDNFHLEQDSDVLDTWFSSALLPLSNFGWPASDNDSESRYYPLTVMETGADILFFWVARMSMLCSFLDKNRQPPFQEVLLHGMVRDAKGRKMSKSKGNGIDPLAVIHGRTCLELEADLAASVSVAADKTSLEQALAALRRDFPEGIPECGTDALRFTLASNVTLQGRNVSFDVMRCEANRRFCNKVWNATRFVLLQVDDVAPVSANIKTLNIGGKLLMMDRWILAKLARCVNEVSTALEKREFGFATSAIQEFLVNDFCDTYVEFAKGIYWGRYGDQGSDSVVSRVMVYTVDIALRLLHPFMPFLTEELWFRLPLTDKERNGVSSLMLARYPLDASDLFEFESDSSAIACGQILKDSVCATRRLMDQRSQARGDIVVECADQAVVDVVSEHAEFVKLLCRNGGRVIATRSVSDSAVNVTDAISTALESVPAVVYFILDDSSRDSWRKAEQASFNKDRRLATDLRAKLMKLLATMSSEAYAKNAPARVRKANDTRVEQLQHQLDQLTIKHGKFL